MNKPEKFRPEDFPINHYFTWRRSGRPGFTVTRWWKILDRLGFLLPASELDAFAIWYDKNIGAQ